MANFIFIDGSYFIFYRYYALLQWWNISKQEPVIEETPPSENERFVELFKTTFVKKIKEISKKLKVDNPIYIVGKDCPREKIWRHSLFDNYKGEVNPTHFFNAALCALSIKEEYKALHFLEKCVAVKIV